MNKCIRYNYSLRKVYNYIIIKWSHYHFINIARILCVAMKIKFQFMINSSSQVLIFTSSGNYDLMFRYSVQLEITSLTLPTLIKST